MSSYNSTFGKRTPVDALRAGSVVLDRDGICWTVDGITEEGNSRAVAMTETSGMYRLPSVTKVWHRMGTVYTLRANN
jgi:hypothetical protein